MDALLQIAPLGAALGLGVLLRRTRLFSQADGETAAKFVAWVTLPSLILQSFNGLNPSELQPLALAAALLAGAITASLSWLAYRARHPKERGLLAGAAAGGAQLALAAYPLAGAAFGPAGLRAALLAGAANALAVWVAGPLLFGTAGAAFPERYEHLDGGTYRGEWLGMLKQGYGVYAYPSGAKYEGEWRNNRKEGRGVYRFPKGGVYEGEWRGGRMEGLGVRTYASGRVQAGVWREGRLESEMEEWQCALAVEGAGEAAAAARRVRVGGGGAADAAQGLLADPAAWAYAAAGALLLAGRRLTPTLDLLTAQLAVAHGPLALLALGLTLELDPPAPRQAADVAGVLALRLLPPLALGAAALAALARAGWPAPAALGLVAPLLLCGVAPAPPQVLANAHRYRLNESLAAAISRASAAAGLVLMPLLAVAASVSAAAGSVLPFLVAVGGVAAAVGGGAAAGAAGLLADRRQQQAPARGKVRMVYAPAEAAAAAGGAAAGAAAPAEQRRQQQQQQQQQPGGGNASAGGSLAAEAAPEPAAAEQPPQEPPRRRSAFSDVDKPQQPPTQALQAPRRGSGGGGGLRWRQPQRLQPPRRQRGLARAHPSALPFGRQLAALF